LRRRWNGCSSAARGEIGFFRAVAVALPLAEIEAALVDPL
jgi:hypothetical protein